MIRLPISLSALLLSTPLSSVAMAQQLGGGAAPEVSLVRMIGALFVCLLLAGLVILYLRHRTGSPSAPILRRLMNNSPEIEVREFRRLTVQHSLALIRHSGREWLLVLSPADTQVLNDLAVKEPSDADD